MSKMLVNISKSWNPFAILFATGVKENKSQTHFSTSKCYMMLYFTGIKEIIWYKEPNAVGERKTKITFAMN